MAPKPQPRPSAPDGEPKVAEQRRGRGPRSKVTRVEDPLIGNGKRREALNTDEPNVDEAGQIRGRDRQVDLLH